MVAATAGAESVISEYVQALGLWGVLVVGADATGTPIRLKVGTDKTGSARVLGAVWFSSQNFADAIASDARRQLARRVPCRRGGWIETNAEEALGVIRDTVSAAQVEFRNDDSIREIAARSIAHADQVIAEMRARGEMRAINIRYREYRTAQLALRRPAMPYPRWLADFKRELIRMVADASIQVDRRSFGLVQNR